MIVTMPSGAMRMKALSGAASPADAADGAAIATRASGGSIACSSSPPPAAALAFRKARREGAGDAARSLGARRGAFRCMIVMITSPPQPRYGSAPPA